MARAAAMLVLVAAMAALPSAGSQARQGDGELHLTTENYPPFNMRDSKNGMITGISTEIVRAIMAKFGHPYRISFLPWQRVFNDALTKASTCVYSTTETAERKPKFKWVGPLAKNDWIFFGRADNDIRIESMAEAKGYTIGGYKGDAVALYLQEKGFNQDLAAFDHLNPRKLKAGRFHLWATGQFLGPYLAALADVAIKPLFSFRETVMSMACNRNVDQRLVDGLNAALGELVCDGTTARILAHYR